MATKVKVEKTVVDSELTAQMTTYVAMRKTKGIMDKEQKAIGDQIKERAEILLTELGADKLFVQAGIVSLSVALVDNTTRRLNKEKLLQFLTVDQIRECEDESTGTRLDVREV